MEDIPGPDQGHTWGMSTHMFMPGDKGHCHAAHDHPWRHPDGHPPRDR